MFVLMAMMTTPTLAQVGIQKPDPECFVPLPKQLEMKPPDASVRPEIARYHGAWVGSWGDDLRHRD